MPDPIGDVSEMSFWRVSASSIDATFDAPIALLMVSSASSDRIRSAASPAESTLDTCSSWPVSEASELVMRRFPAIGRPMLSNWPHGSFAMACL